MVIEVGEVPLSMSTMVPKQMTTASCLFLKYPSSSLRSQVHGLSFLSFLCSKYRKFHSPELLIGIPPARLEKKYTDELLGACVEV